MSSTSQRLIKHGSVYLLSNVLRRSVSFIMLPIYTQYLSAADYGVLELLSMVIDFVAIIFGMQVANAIFRYYARYDEEKDKNEVISTSLLLVFCMNIAGVLLIWFTAHPLTRIVFGTSNQAALLILFSLTLVMQSLINIPMVFLKAREKSFTYLGFSISKLVLQLGLNIYLIVFLGMRVEGVIYSALISGIIISSVLAIYTLSITGIRYSFAKAREIVRFSLPLVGATLLAFYLTFGDRYFLRIFRGVDEVGIYSLAYKFGFLLSFLVGEPFNNIWQAEMFHVAKKENAVQTYQKVFLLFSSLILFCSVGICVFIKEFLMIMSAPEFWPAARIVPLIVAAYVFQSWTGYGSLGSQLKGRTINITYGTMLAAVVITPGYLVLIPLFGATGAATATIMAFIVRCWYINWSSAKLFNMHLQWKRVALAGVLSIGIVLASLIGPEALLTKVLFDIMLMLLFMVLFFLMPILPFDMRSMALKILLRPKVAITYLK